MTTIYKVLNQYKETIPFHIPYVLVIIDKIVHASPPIKKIFKQDPTGRDMGTFMTLEEKKTLSERGHLIEGLQEQNWRIGSQIMHAKIEVMNREFAQQILSLVLVKGAEIVLADAA